MGVCTPPTTLRFVKEALDKEIIDADYPWSVSISVPRPEEEGDRGEWGRQQQQEKEEYKHQE